MSKAYRVWFVVSTMLLATSLSGITGCSKATEAQKNEVQVKSVAMTKVAKQTIDQVTEVTGTLEASDQATVSFEVAGRIVKLNKDQGQTVQAGEFLGQLEDSDYQLGVQKAATAVEQAQASLEKVDNGARPQEIEQVKIGLERAQLNSVKAQDDLKKYEALYQSGAISKDAYDNIVLKAQLAEKDLQNAQSSLSVTVEGARKEDKESTLSTYQQMLVQKAQADLSLQKTTLKSPVTGTIISKLSSEGQMTSAGSPIYQIGNIGELKVVLPVPDREVANWSVGDSVNLDLYGDKREGKVQMIYPNTNAGTGTIGVEVRINNDDHKWFAGQVVKATHQRKGAQGLFVPVEAVVSTGAKPYVFVVKDQKAAKTEVQTGQLMNNQLQILSGLSEGQTIVTKGADRLFDGDAIAAESNPGTEAGGTGK
ncbi:MAG TPA: efflux RND transporter periplasmic adaptor subunit [Bacillota bacterium]|nr:efflux RND transporter periplasmic adaptor subunit [Bacillota bacterium]